MINPFLYFDRPVIYQRGLNYKDINKNNTTDIYITMESILICQLLIFNGIMKIPD